MGTASRDYPPGGLRVSDADRDRALSELSEALQAGRITAGEFDQRSGQVLRARTGHELTAPLADLPLDRAPAARATTPERAGGAPFTRITIGASVVAAAFATVAVANALSSGAALARYEYLRDLSMRRGRPIPVLHAPAVNWAGTLTPAAIAVLLVVLIIFLRVTRSGTPSPPARPPG